MRKLVPVLALAALLCGCVESTTLLTVNKDGSGTVTVREFLSPQLTQMMEGMGGMMAAGMGAAPADGAAPPEPPKPMDLFKDAIEKKVKQLGPGVELVQRQDGTNAVGWKGYTAVFKFPDVAQLNVEVGGDGPGGGGDGDEGEKKQKSAFRFAFAPGSPATLQIVPAEPQPAQEPAAAAPAPPEGADQMGAQMMAMMGPMLKGMRLTMLVQVNGKIRETNASHPIPGRNAVVVMDLPMDQVVANPEAMKLMAAKDPQLTAKLQKMNLGGVKLEEPGKTLTIKFD